MSGTTTIRVGRAEHAVQPARDRMRRRLRWRHLWIIPGLVVAIVANQLGNEIGVGILALIAFGITPDLPRLLGLGRRPVDSVPVRVFNLLHHPGAAIAALAIGATGIVPVIWLVGSLVWLGHVVIGWGIGDVPRGGGDRSDACSGPSPLTHLSSCASRAASVACGRTRTIDPTHREGG